MDHGDRHADASLHVQAAVLSGACRRRHRMRIAWLAVKMRVAAYAAKCLRRKCHQESFRTLSNLGPAKTGGAGACY